MDARATRRGVPAGVIWGGLGVVLWSAFALFSPGAAHAEESDQTPVGGLTSLIGQTVTAVTEPVVTQVVAPVVTQVVAPVVHTVVAPVQQVAPAAVTTVTDTVAAVPVVGPAAAPVVQVVADTTTAVTTPVTDLLSDSPVTQITAPILDAVTGLPVIGGLVDDLGVTGVVRDVVSVIDQTAGLIGDVTTETLPPVIGALTPATPGAGSGPAHSGEDLPATAIAPSSSSSLERTAASLRLRAFAGTTSTPSATDDSGRGGTDPAGLPADGTPAAPPGTPASPTSSAGPGGSSSHAHARLSDSGVPPLHSWARTSGASDDALPASPVADTDVSPD